MCIMSEIYDQCALCFRLEILISYGPLSCDHAQRVWSPPSALIYGDCPGGMTTNRIVYTKDKICEGCCTPWPDSSSPALTDRSSTQDDLWGTSTRQLGPIGHRRPQASASWDKSEHGKGLSEPSSSHHLPQLENDEDQDWPQFPCPEPDADACLCRYMF